MLLTSFKESDLKKMIREVLDEKLSSFLEPKKSKQNITYLNRFEVADRLRISLPTLNNWSKEGIVQSYRIGNRVLFREDEIHSALKEVRNLKYKRA